MFVSMLWDTIFEINERYEEANVFLIDNRIPALQFGTADKPAVFAAGFGAEEWQTSVLLLKFFETLLRDVRGGGNMAGIAVKKAFQKRSVVIIPTVCPGAMRHEGGTPAPADLQAIATYLSYHKAGLLITVEKEKNTVFSPRANAALPADTATIEKILAACARLPLTHSASGAAAKLCEWASAKNALPAFSISPRQLEASDLAPAYNALEEAFTVSALI